MEEKIGIIAIVERGKADKIVDKAKVAGAKGATILYGRGTGESEIKKFLNIQLAASKRVILIVSAESTYEKIYDTMVEVGNLKKPGTGIIFTMHISNLLGLRHRKEF